MKCFYLVILSCSFFLNFTSNYSTSKFEESTCLCNSVSDSLALIELYNNTNGTNWTNTWELNQPINTWIGVELNSEGCVQKLIMDNNQLAGNLPDLSLPYLEVLILRDNQLQGAIPDFGDLNKIETIWLDNNQLSGNLPDFGNLNMLEQLILRGNNLSGNIPNFTNLPMLWSLNLFDNQFIGSIPDFANLANLWLLDLSNNQLTGSIPNFSNLKKLDNLSLGNNNFGTEIPNFDQLDSLTSLSISNGNIVGNIPNFSFLPNLKFLALADNNLIGNIPLFSNFPKLETLSLNGNQLEGEIPDFDLPNLSILTLSNNNLNGTVPLFNLSPNLIFLDIQNNELDSLPLFVSINLTQNSILGGNNNFTFEDIIPNKTQLGQSYFPQDSIFQEETKILYVGEDYSINLNIDNGINGNIYKWFKDGNLYSSVQNNNFLELIDIQTNNSGLYTCEVTNNEGALLTLYSRPINIIVLDSTAMYIFNINIIDGGCIPPLEGMIDITISNETPPISFLWSNGATSEDLTNISDGEYFVTITDANGQIIIQEFEIDINENLVASFAGDDELICEDSIYLIGNLPLNTTGIWETEFVSIINTPNNNSTLITELSTGENIFTWTLSTIDCPNYSTDSVSVFIPDSPILADDFLLFSPNDVIEFNLLENDYLSLNQNNWILEILDFPQNVNLEELSFGEFQLDLFQQESSSITFTYKICNNVCSELCDTAVVIIQTNESIPTAITPNGDGLNDFFVIPQLENSASDFPQNELIVFNRWGNIVFQSKPYNNNWSGTNMSNKPIPEGTYYYVLRLNVGEGNIKKGNITILR